MFEVDKDYLIWVLIGMDCLPMFGVILGCTMLNVECRNVGMDCIHKSISSEVQHISNKNNVIDNRLPKDKA